MPLAAYRRALPLLRIPFSVYLMPVYWFGLSALREPFSIGRAVAVFVVLHLLAYPASNGYNSYYDRDEDSIGGLKHPPKVSPELLHLVWLFDALAVLGSLWLSWWFGALVIGYLLVSKAYSFEGIRLKKYPLLSTLVVIVFQGAYTFLMTQIGVGASSTEIHTPQNLLLALVSSLFLCGSYPLTQVYQHQEDSRRGDQTLSLRLGVRGTFVFAGLGLLAGAATLAVAYIWRQELPNLLIFLIATGPVVVLFLGWARAVWQNPAAASFERTMRMNQVSSLCLSAAFLLMLLRHWL
ncbi:1,4-dihydroxy-2-naphthoate octaprenyltransferase [Hymenobacter gelipurpurascens]|uniref:1,4-dihydroxy-2-naphthoate octaprenyltransferase n=1 Tax=Hymenobacter gelipurpurascens TaxID=89968 RepID=A0A212U9Z2_9BACT|nr:UbiA family prenyltransferase [Hymenobacter gelipurpurascens]SNC75112.1 1,4-dihydroxy-2-naphthoate octaprenyltransferase [Hymenobacter gelipurpurascens]